MSKKRGKLENLVENGKGETGNPEIRLEEGKKVEKREENAERRNKEKIKREQTN